MKQPDTFENEIDFLRGLLTDVFWDIEWHEQELIKERKKRGIAAALLARFDCDFTLKEAREFYNEYGDDEDELEKPDDVLKCWLGGMGMGDYHETSLQAAHAKLGALEALLKRVKFPEISIDDCRDAALKQLAERREQDREYREQRESKRE